tara:strand:- start:247 stop:504 length:258 start_codon:yes stop_codon:yes gene_type:complete
MPRYKNITGLGKVPFTPEEEAEADKQDIIDNKEIARLAKVKYKDDRKMAYPEIGDQLDDLFKRGAFSEEMTAKLQQVKTDHPKPE